MSKLLLAVALVVAIVGISLVVLARRNRAHTPSADMRLGSNQSSIEVGGLYRIRNEDGTWGVIKVLALDERAVHLRSYANKFEKPPQTDLDPNVLRLGGLKDPGGFGIGHYPLAREGFFFENPELIKVEPVKDEELEGYRIYLEAMSGEAAMQ